MKIPFKLSVLLILGCAWSFFASAEEYCNFLGEQDKNVAKNGSGILVRADRVFYECDCRQGVAKFAKKNERPVSLPVIGGDVDGANGAPNDRNAGAPSGNKRSLPVIGGDTVGDRNIVGSGSMSSSKGNEGSIAKRPVPVIGGDTDMLACRIDDKCDPFRVLSSAHNLSFRRPGDHSWTSFPRTCVGLN